MSEAVVGGAGGWLAGVGEQDCIFRRVYLFGWTAMPCAFLHECVRKGVGVGWMVGLTRFQPAAATGVRRWLPEHRHSPPKCMEFLQWVEVESPLVSRLGSVPL